MALKVLFSFDIEGGKDDDYSFFYNEIKNFGLSKTIEGYKILTTTTLYGSFEESNAEVLTASINAEVNRIKMLLGKEIKFIYVIDDEFIKKVLNKLERV